MAAHPDEWDRYREGEDKLAGFFTGAVMKATKGQADGKAVAAELRRLRASRLRGRQQGPGGEDVEARGAARRRPDRPRWG